MPITTETDASVTDLEALALPFSTEGEMVANLSTNEGDDVYQTCTVDDGVQTTTEVFIGNYE
jgi:hypothetical protein